METRESKAQKPGFDIPTLAAISALAYVLATFLHEHIGHALACILLGGSLTELGAFYVAFNAEVLPELSQRIIALSGPVMSFITGLAGFFLFNRATKSSPQLRYFLWLFSTISLMTATGYLLFSGVSGLGDFGNTPDGATFQLEPAWLWRLILIASGAVSYVLVVFFSVNKMNNLIGGEGRERIKRAQWMAIISYFSGAVAAVLIGLLNPYGLVIILISAIASTMGGTSGLLWMMRLLNRRKSANLPPIRLERSWLWIVIGFGFVIIYGIIFGPTIRL